MGFLRIEFMIQRVTKIKSESIISAAVVPQAMTVAPHGGIPVNGPKVKEDTIVCPLFLEFETASIPEPMIFADPFLYTRQGGLHWEWYEKWTIKRLGLRCSDGTDCVLPEAVEVLPAVSFHLRSRVFWMHVLWRDALTPGRHESRGDSSWFRRLSWRLGTDDRDDNA